MSISRVRGMFVLSALVFSCRSRDGEALCSLAPLGLRRNDQRWELKPRHYIIGRVVPSRKVQISSGVCVSLLRTEVRKGPEAFLGRPCNVTSLVLALLFDGNRWQFSIGILTHLFLLTQAIGRHGNGARFDLVRQSQLFFQSRLSLPSSVQFQLQCPRTSHFL